MLERMFSDFGVQPILLLAQIVNFLILFLVLRKFLYPPIFKVLEARKNGVLKSLENEDKIEQRLLAIENEVTQRLSVASKEANKIIDTASNTADEIIAKAHQKGQSDIELMLEQAQYTISQQQEDMKKEMSTKYAQLVIVGVEKITNKVLGADDHKRIIRQQLKDLDNNL
ncbi:MAG: F0F1 ATP synthase subunit B [Methylococcales symbiont of Iophon sp. n. MRB-2018]|nr:MAG: F0F1 ATP synthase subunit B [Methylococcales symbiont of Iophon sp. n. MRB-2018]KAF3978820.1 MAG: F0F1 ATP synthase subunit B [Methylococcales symbiont of Iophon sp. n. MRB-2018]